MFAPLRKAKRYRYSAPGPYRQLSKFAVTVAFRLSTNGMAVDVLVSVDVVVCVGVLGSSVDVSVGIARVGDGVSLGMFVELAVTW
jgi:hypothetical protein